MTRKALERHLREHGCFLHHHGGSHDIWVNGTSGAQAPVARHATLKRGTVHAASGRSVTVLRYNLWRDVLIVYANALVPLNADGLRADVIPLAGIEATL